MQNRRTLTALLAAASLAPLPMRAGILSDAASETRQDRPATEDRGETCEDHEDDNGLGSFLWDITVGAFFHSLWGSTWEETTDACGHTHYRRWYYIPPRDDLFAPFPYAAESPGVLSPARGLSCGTFPFSARFGFELGHDSDLTRYAGTGFATFQNGIALDASGHIYREDLPAGGQDELSIGDVNFLYRMYQNDLSLWHLGIGANWLADSIDTEAGLNFTLRADIFPIKPLVFTGELDGGTIGSAFTSHARASLGINLRQAEIFIGYDYRKIGDIDLTGPMLGAQFWY